MIPCREALIGSAHQVKGHDRRGPRHQETTDAEVPAPQALPRRPGAATCGAADGRVGARGRGGACGLSESRQRAAGGEWRVRRRACARAGADVGALRRPGCRPHQQRRPAPRNQPSGRRLVDDRRRVARARGRARGLRVLRARVVPEPPPRDPRAWVQTVATRRLVDARRSEAARHRREETTYAEPRAGGPTPEEGDDTLFLLFCCCHPDLAPASQVALTLRAVGGLTTQEIADAFYVPEATMAQRISRAKRALAGPPARRLDQPGDLAVVLRVLYLIYTAGHAGRMDLAGEAIRLTRQLTLATEEPEA